MKKKTRQKWMLLILAAALCGMLAGCGSDGGGYNRNRDLETKEEDRETEDREDKEEADEDSDRPNVTFKNAISWGYSGSNIWLFKDGALVICADTGEIPEGEMQEEIPKGAVRSVYAEKGVTVLSGDMLEGCSNLISVEMASDTEAAIGAFTDCPNLASIKIPNAETVYIGGELGSLTSVELPNAVYVGGFEECSSLTSVELPNAVYVEGFSSCNSLTSVELPNAVYVYGFSGCNSLTSVELPNAVAVAGFCGCVGLTSVELPNAVSVGGRIRITLSEYDEEKQMMQALRSKAGSTAAAAAAAGGERSWAEIREMSSAAESAIKSAISGEFEMTVVGRQASFDRCDSLTSVEMPNAVYVGGFKECSSLTSVEMPNAVYVDGFEECSSLTSVDMPNVQSIGERAFDGCSSLTNVEMPNVTEIGNWAFGGCPYQP